MQQKTNELLQSMYEEHQAALRVLARAYGVPDKDVDDVVQETFIAYFEHYSLEWTPNRKRAMLVRILKNRCMDYHRLQKNRSTVSLNSSEYLEDLAARASGEDAVEAVLEHETYEMVKTAISKMSKDLQDAAILHLIEGRPQKEVSEILGISIDACRARISRAKKFLREKLGPELK